MAKRSAVIRNRDGIHVRPSMEIAASVEGYSGRITIKSGGMKGGISVMDLLGMGLVEGARVDIVVEGEEEEMMAKKVKGLFEKIYDFPPQ